MFVFVQPVIHLDCALVTFGFITETSQRTATAVLCTVTDALTAVAACGLWVGCSYAGHVLSHRTDIVVLFGIVVEGVVVEGIGFVARTLFEMEAVVLDICLHSGLVHEAVVFFGSIT